MESSILYCILHVKSKIGPITAQVVLYLSLLLQFSDKIRKVCHVLYEHDDLTGAANQVKR